MNEKLMKIAELSARVMRGETLFQNEKEILINFYINDSGLSRKEIYEWLVMIDEDTAQAYFDDHFYMTDGDMYDIPDDDEPNDYWDDDDGEEI